VKARIRQSRMVRIAGKAVWRERWRLSYWSDDGGDRR